MARVAAPRSTEETIAAIAAQAASEIVDLVRAAVADAVLRVVESPAPLESVERAAAGADVVSEPAFESAAAPPPVETPAPAVAAAPTEAAAPPPSGEAPPPVAAPPRIPRPSPAADPLIASVRSQLSAAFFGRPVTAERLALLLRQDPVLVDAALVYLVGRKEVWARNVKGKPAYVPRIARPG
jgi:hypothetical protein